MEKIEEEIRSLIVKVLIPAIVAVSIKLAIASRKNKMTIFNIITSFIIGIGSAYLFSSFILSHFSDEYVPLMIALVTISGEKIGNWVIYTFNVDAFIKAMIERYSNGK